MDIREIHQIIARGEDSMHQFKGNVTNAESIAAEMTAFLNTEGGIILIGVDDKTNSVSGLSPDDIYRINQIVSNAASQLVKPACNPLTENILYDSKTVMVVKIPKGISKPYMDNKGTIWLKSGSDKRKVTSREEIQRMFQSSGLLHGDDIPVDGLTVDSLNKSLFAEFFQKEFGEDISTQEISIASILENMNLMKNGLFTVAGALLFAKNAHYHLPLFIVKAIVYPGTDIDEENYMDSRDIRGHLQDIFHHTVAFLMMYIRHEQAGQSVNSLGIPEIPKIVFEELVVNALIHRDYFISAPIRIFIFRNRIEIISPGHLPNNLTVNNIKAGNSNIRNPVLASFATKMLPYRGLGNGIRRALKAHPDIDFIDGRDDNTFKVIIHR